MPREAMSTLALNNSDQDLTDVFHHRQIVTSFICTSVGSSFKDFKVAIFKRSNQTRSHQYVWA